MRVVIGIDVGGSTTKICGIEQGSGKLISPQLVRADDPITSVFGAFGKFTAENGLSLSDIDRVMITGVGSSFVEGKLYGLPSYLVPEFTAVALGGLYLSSLEKALVVSMGTGTAVVYAQKGKAAEYMGGTGVGGGTLMGLSRLLLKLDGIEHLSALAKDGDLHKIDLRIGDITAKDVLSVSKELTAANFGKLSDLADKSDIALGLLNMVYETVGMIAIFAARSKDTKDIVLTGNLSNLPYAAEIFPTLTEMFGVNFIIPENSPFSTVIGTALCANEKAFSDSLS